MKARMTAFQRAGHIGLADKVSLAELKPVIFQMRFTERLNMRAIEAADEVSAIEQRIDKVRTNEAAPAQNQVPLRLP